MTLPCEAIGVRARISSAVGLLAVVALFTAGSAQAAITVANTADSGPGSLRQAIADAPPGEVILVPAGTYTLTSGPLNVAGAVSVAGAATADTVIRSGGAFRVIEMGGEFPVVLRDLTIRDGHPAEGVTEGGGILSSATDLTLLRVAVVDNVADSNGAAGKSGGIAQGGGIYHETGRLTVLDSIVSGNVATANGSSEHSGGISQGGGISSIGQLTIVNTTIAGNRAIAQGGNGPPNVGQVGGIAQGGGVFTVVPTGSPGAFVGSTISGNRGDAAAGPGSTSGIVQGGGLFLTAAETPASIINSTLAGNLARVPGGIAQGGGVFGGAAEAGSLDLISTTVSGNALDGSIATSTGGNLYLFSSAHLKNSIVANGTGPAGSENCAEFEGLSSGFNIDSLDQCGFKSPGDRVNTDPLLGPLAANGGPTETMAPAIGSPAVDQGSAFGLTADQRGILRPIDLPTIPNPAVPGADGSDIGAVELQPSNAVTLGKLKRNKKKGTATLIVNLPAPSVGTLSLTGKGLKPQNQAIAGETQLKLRVAIRNRKIRKALRRRGRRKVGLSVTYAPTGNAAATASRKAKLVFKKKRRKHRKHSSSKSANR